MARLHDQSWVRGDYSDVIVGLSRAFGALRGDEEPEEQNTEKQVTKNDYRVEIGTMFFTILHTCVYIQCPIIFRLLFDRQENIGCMSTMSPV